AVVISASGAAGAQTPPDAAKPAAKTPSVTEIPRWLTIHLDSQLGVVIGGAWVDWSNQRAQVDFAYGGKKSRLSSGYFQSPSDEDPHIQIYLNGTSPAAPTTARPDTTTAKRVTGAKSATVKIAHENAEFAFGTPEAADSGHVRLELAPTGAEAMMGRWGYKADPVTVRDATGDGRSGQFAMASDGSFGGKLSGSEIWLPLHPEIEFAAVLDDQLEIPYLTFEDTLSAETLREKSGKAGDVDKRYLFVVGRNLPIVPANSSDGIYTSNAGKFESTFLDTDYKYVGQSGDDLPLRPAQDPLRLVRGDPGRQGSGQTRRDTFSRKRSDPGGHHARLPSGDTRVLLGRRQNPLAAVDARCPRRRELRAAGRRWQIGRAHV